MSVIELLTRKAKKSHSTSNSSTNLGEIQIGKVSNDWEDEITVIEVKGPVSLELFYRACAAVSASGWNIRSAKVSANGTEVQASMYVTGARNLTERNIHSAMSDLLQDKAIPGLDTVVR